jgi:hypothetical protein
MGLAGFARHAEWLAMFRTTANGIRTGPKNQQASILAAENQTQIEYENE